MRYVAESSIDDKIKAYLEDEIINFSCGSWETLFILVVLLGNMCYDAVSIYDFPLTQGKNF
ncbi:MAG: hypothetical protein JJV97_05720 [SAR324 cluster bacterium]|nr:hypothetical protein [SAR324 cluster bacterium]